jgi:hypothetical protein
MADQDFKIVITSTADTTGFKQAAAATGDLAKAGSKSADSAAAQTLKHEELKKVLQEMGNATVPGLGRSLSQLAMGPVGAALALVGAYQMLKDKITEADAAMDAMGVEAAKPIGSGVEAYRKSLDDARVALGNFYAALKHAGVDNDPIKTEIDRAKALADAKLEAENQVRQAMGLPPLAKIGDSAALMAEQSDREAAAPGLEKDAATKRTAANEAKRKLDTDQTAIGILSKQLGLSGSNLTYDTESKKLEDLEKERAARQRQYDNNPTALNPARIELARINVEIDEINQARGRRSTLLGQLEGGLTGRAQVAADAELSANESEGQLKQNNARRRQIPGLLSHTQKMEGVQEDAGRVVDVLNTRGGQMNKTLGQLASATGKTQEETINIVQSILSRTTTMSQRISQLERQLQAVQRTGSR